MQATTDVGGAPHRHDFRILGTPVADYFALVVTCGAIAVLRHPEGANGAEVQRIRISHRGADVIMAVILITGASLECGIRLGHQ